MPDPSWGTERRARPETATLPLGLDAVIVRTQKRLTSAGSEPVLGQWGDGLMRPKAVALGVSMETPPLPGPSVVLTAGAEVGHSCRLGSRVFAVSPIALET